MIKFSWFGNNVWIMHVPVAYPKEQRNKQICQKWHKIETWKCCYFIFLCKYKQRKRRRPLRAPHTVFWYSMCIWHVMTCMQMASSLAAWIRENSALSKALVPAEFLFFFVSQTCMNIWIEVPPATLWNSLAYSNKGFSFGA